MLDHVVKEQVELVPTNENSTGVFYLPDHAEKKEHHGKTNWRIVFDPSSSEGNSPSLNDVLEMGPNLLPEVLANLLHFRGHPVPIIGDIQQTFLQLSLDQKDRDLTRFLWTPKTIKATTTPQMRWLTYRFTCLPFSLTCSPFLLSVTERELATMCTERYPNFMDDFVAGAEDGKGAISIYYEIGALMKTIKLPMAKWATSCEELKEIWKAECQGIQRMMQALGVDWNKESDMLSVDPTDILDKTAQGPATKRQLLQTNARFYDPLGLFSPVSAIAKILF